MGNTEMDIEKRRKIAAILRVLANSDNPLGRSAISSRLAEMGVNLRERMVRNYLELTDEQGLTKNLGRRGRVLTELGSKELDVGIAVDKVGFVNSRIDELSYKMTFDDRKLTGNIILNVSLIETWHERRTLEDIARVIRAGYGMGQHLLIGYSGQTVQGMTVPNGHMAVGTICSVTLNGVLLRHGVPMISRFGGLLDIVDRTPVRFSQIINYDGSTIDPLEIFIKSKMTSVNKAAATGTGSIGVSFREISIAALPAAKAVIDTLVTAGLASVIMIGKPNQPLLDIPVSTGRVGVIVAAGLNPIAAIEEAGLSTTNRAMHTLCELGQLQRIENITGI